MITSPDTTLRVANSERVQLSLCVDAPLLEAVLVPRFGEGQALVIEDGTIELPFFKAPDFIKIKWLGEGVEYTSYVEIVSSHYFSLKALREYGDGKDIFDTLPEETLFMARQAATDVFEEASHRSWVHRIGRTKDHGRVFYLSHNDVYQLLTPGYQLVSDCQVVPDGTVHKAFPIWIEYLYGADAIPAEVSHAVLELCAYTLRPSNRPVGATAESTDAGYIHYTIAGRDGATAIPEVNAAIQMFGRREAVVW